MRPFFVAVIGSLLIAVFALSHALMKHPPYAPEINAKQHSKRAIEGEHNAKGETPAASMPDKGHTPGHGEKTEEEGSEFWPPLLGYRIKITDSLLVAFTFGLTVFTGLLWKSTAGLFAVTKIVADGDRPHLIPSEIAISGIRQPPSADGFIKTKFTYKFVNYGRSPAFLKRYCLFVRVASKEMPPIPEYDTPVRADHIIVVNGWWGSVDSSPNTISLIASDAAELLAGTCKMIILGFIEYSDTASQDHKMRFAYELEFGPGDASTQFRPTGPDSYREYT